MAKTKIKTCEVCLSSFRGRADARTCSTRCRKRLQRRALALAREAEKVVVRVEAAAKAMGSELEELIVPANATQEGFIASPTPGNVVSPGSAAGPMPPNRPAAMEPVIATPPPQPVATSSSPLISETYDLDPDKELEFSDSSKTSKGMLKLMSAVLALILVMAGILAILDFSGLLPSNYSQKITVNKLGDSVQNITNQVSGLNKQVITLRGETGATGSIGQSGANGQSGSSGANGANGEQGPAGPQGPAGSDGTNGATGATGPAGATGPQGPQGPSGSASCPNGQCVSLQATSPGVQEAGNISITGNMNVGGIYMVNGNQIAIANLADAGNIARLNGTGPQTFTGNNKFTGTVLSQNVFNTVAAFQVQNAAGNGILTVDTVNDRVAINQSTANYTLDVNGDINTTTGYRVNGSPLSSSNLSDSTNIAHLTNNQTFSGINSFTNGSNSFTGIGTGLTQLNASNLTSGTVDDARLPNTLVKLDQNNTFTGKNIFQYHPPIGQNAQQSFAIQNSGGVNLLVADADNMRIAINKSSANYTLDVNGTINGTTLLQNGNDVCDVSGNCAGVGGQIGGNGTPGTIAMFTTGSATIGDSLITQSGGTIGIAGNLNLTGVNPKYQINGSQISSGNLSDSSNLARLNANQTFTGDNIIRHFFTGSSTSFQVQTPGGTDVLLVDTANSRVGIGQNTASYSLDVVGDINTTTGFRVGGSAGTGVTCTAGDVVENAVVVGGIITGGDCIANGGAIAATITLQNAYNNSSTPATIVTSAAAKNIVFQSGAGFDASSLFQLQNAAGNYLFNTDTLNSQVQVGQADLLVSEGNLTVSGVTSPTPTLTSSSSGGTLPVHTYLYMLSVNNYHGTNVAVVSSPPSVTTSGSTSKNTLTWTAVPNVVSYNIYRSINNGTTWFVNTVPAGTTTLVDDGTNFTWGTAGTPDTVNTSGGDLTAGGKALFKNASNSLTAFQIQDADSNAVLTADTTDRFIGIGTAAPLAALDVEAPSASFFYGFEAGTLNPFTSVSGWSAVSNNARSGSWSAKTTTQGTTLSLSETLNSPGTITFWAKTSYGGGCCSSFTMQDNGSTDLSLSFGPGGGSTPYTKYSYAVGAGSHSFTWTTSGISAVTDFVDDVTVTNASSSTAAIFNGGNVGIGTSFPTATLEVSGTELIKPSSIDTSTLFQVQNAEGGSIFNVDSLNSAVTVSQGSLLVTGLGTPSTPSVSNSSNQGGSLSGNPATTYYYRITAVNTAGKETLASPETSFSAAGFTPLSAPGAPSVTATTGSDLGVGTYRYKVTYVTANGETTGGTTAAVTTTSGNQDVSINSIPVGPAGTIARKLYRTAVGGLDGSQQLLTTINDNSTASFLDNIPDGSLGTGLPGSNTATTNNNETSLSFATIAGATSYHVYRGTAPGAETAYQTTATVPFIDTGAAGTASSTPTSSGIETVGIGTSTPTANLTVAGTALFQNAINTAGAFSIQNAAGNNVLGVDTAGAQVLLGKASAQTGILTFNNSTNASTASIQAGVTSGSYTLTLPTALPGSNQCLQTNNTGVITFTACIGGSSATLAAAYGNGSAPADSTITLDSTRQGVLIKDAASPIGGTLFGVQSNNGTSKYLDVTASGVTVSGTIDASGGYKVAGTSGSGITCSGGQVVQNAVINGGIITGGTCTTNGVGATLQSAYDASSSPATITTSSAAKNVIVKAGASNDSTGIFQIQNSSGLPVLNADSVNRYIGINQTTPNATLDVQASSSSFFDGFESGSLSPFTGPGWTASLNNPHSGSYSAQLLQANVPATLTLVRTLSSVGTVSFWQNVNLGGCGSNGQFQIDGVTQATYVCAAFPYALYSYAVSSGTHTFTWTTSNLGGGGSWYVDDVTVTNAGAGTTALFNGGNVGIGTSFPNATLDVAGTSHFQATAGNDSTALFQIQSSTGTNLFTVDSVSSKISTAANIVASGSSTATTATTSGTGTNTTTVNLVSGAFSNNDVIFIDNAGQDYYTRIISGGGTTTLTVSPAVSYDNAATVTKYNVQNIGATSSDYTTQANRFFQGYFLGGVVTGAGSTIYSDGNIKSVTNMQITAPSIVLQTTGSSGSAFQILNGSGKSLFNVDTNNNNISLGTAGPSGQDGVIVFNNASNSSTVTIQTGATASSYSLLLPTTGPGTNQCIVTDSTTANQLKFGSCGTGFTPSTTLQNAYDNSSSPATITTSSASKNIIVKAGSGNDSTGLFQIQDSGGNSILDADSAHRFVGINNANPNATLDVLASSSSFIDGFETGTLSPFTSAAGWSASQSHQHTGNYAAVSTTSSSTVTLSLTRTLSSAGTVSFWETLMSGACGVTAHFNIDGVAQLTQSTGGCNQLFAYAQYSYSVSSGTHTFTWDENNSGGFMSVDDVTITNAGAGTAALFNGGNVGIGTGFPNQTLDVLGTAHFQASSDNSSEFSVQNVAGNNYLLVDTSGANLYVGNTGIASTIQIGNTTGAVAQTINVGNNATASSSTNVSIGSTIGGSTTNITAGSGGINLNAATTVASNISFTARGSALFKDATNSTSALQVQDSSGNSVLNADSVNRFVGINNANPNATLDVLASSSSFTDGFETGVASPFTANSPWVIGLGSSHTGTFSANLTGNSQATLTLTSTLNSPGTISFWARVNMSGASQALFFVDATSNTVASNFGNFGYTLFSYPVSAGTHTFTWRLNGSDNNGGVIYGVDDVTVTNAGAGTTALFNGGNVGIGTSFPNQTLDVLGTSHFQASSDSTSLFQVQSANATTLLNIDSSNMDISIGQSSLTLSDLSAPTSPGVAAGANTGGTLSGAAGTTYFYKVTGLSGTGESLGSSEVSINGQSFTKLATPGALTAAASATAGNVSCNNTAGQGCKYEVTFVTANGETTGGTASASVLNVTSKQINLTNIPTGPTGTTARNIYRSTNNSAFLLDQTVNDNVTTSATDNVASPAGAIPGSNTATTNLNNATVTWTAVTGATGYRIYRGTAAGAETAYQAAASSPFTDTGAAGTAGNVHTFSSIDDIGIGTSTPTANLDVRGNVLFKNVQDTSTAFQIQNAAATETLLSVDTTARSASGGNIVKIGNNTGTDTNTTILQVDSSTADVSSNLSVLNGGIFYNSTTGKLSYIEGNIVKQFSNSLQNAYDNSTSPATITTSSATKNVIVKAGASNDSTGIFQVQDSSGSPILDTDSVNRYVGIGTSGPNATLDVQATSASFTDGFETGSLAPFTATGIFAATNNNGHSGSWSAAAVMPPRTGSNLTLVKTLISPGTVSFWMKASYCCNINGVAEFSIDGTSKVNIGNNTTTGYTFYSFAVGSGTHTFVWSVVTFSTSDNFTYVDDVTVTNTGAGTAALFNGGNVGIGTGFPNQTLDVLGTSHFQASSDSTTLLQVQNAAGTTMLNADSTNMQITVGQSSLLVTDLSAPTSPGVAAGANTGGTLSGAAGTTYFYKVTALSGAGESLSSSEVSINGQSFTKLSAPGAPTVATGAAGGLTGAYTYKVTFVTANGETIGGTTSATVNPASQVVSLTGIPTGPSGTTARKIYRTAAGGVDGTQKLVTTINDNSTTTLIDNTADGSLGAALPGSNTATTNTNNATISWTAVTGATNYRIYRGTASGAESAYQTSAASPFTDTGAAGTAGTIPTRSSIAQIGVGTSSPTANLDIRGTTLFKNAQDTTTAYQLQNAAGGNLFNADTLNSNVTIGQGNLLVTGLGTPAAPVLSAGSNQGGTFSGAAGSTYFYKVTAINSAGNETLASAESSFSSSNFTPLTPPTALTAAASVTAGNVSCNNTAGQGCKYEVTFVTANGETTGGTATASLLNVASKQITLTNIPTGPSGTTARKIYRSTNNGAFLLDQTINDNTTVAGTDNVAAPAGAIPGANTATTNLNNITVTFTPIPGTASYRIYRGTATGAESAYQTTATSPFTDTGAAGTAATPLTYDGTANLGIGTSTPTANLDVRGTVNVAGTALFKNAVNTTTAFQVQDAGGSSALNVDTTNRFVGINNANPQATLDVLASSSSFIDGFETGALSPFTTIANGGSVWTIVNSNQHSGSFAAHKNDDKGDLILTRTLASNGTISFWMKNNASGQCAHAQFLIDGVVQLSLGFTNTPYTLYSYSVASGTHTFDWNGTSCSTINTWVDDVTVTNAGVGTTAAFNGGNVGIGTAFPNQTLDVLGASHFQASSDSTSLFQVQNAAGTSLFNIDSTNSEISTSQAQILLTDNSTPAGLGVVVGANTGGSLSGAAGTTYYYKVTALNSNGETLASSEASINGQSFTKLTTPAAPTGSATTGTDLNVGNYLYKLTKVTANGETTAGTQSATITTTSGNQDIALTLPAVPTGATGYHVYRTIVGGASNSEALITAGGCSGTISTTSCTDSATDAQLSGSPPASNTATTNLNNATISWTAVTGATSYRIYRGTAAGAETAYQTSASSPFTDTGAAGTSSSTPTYSAWGAFGVGTSAPTANLDIRGTALFKNAVDGATAFQVQNAAGANILVIDSTNNKVTVTNLVITASITVNGHFITGNSSGSTTVAAGTAANCAGSSPTIVISGNDTAGTVTITTDATPACVAGTLATVTFANSFGSAPHILLTPAGANASTLQYYNNTSGTGSFTIDTNTAPTAATIYKFNYWVVQ